MVNQTLDGDYISVGWTILDMIYNVNNITQSCGNGMQEVIQGLVSYYNSQYPSNVINNFIFNFGNIFDSVRNTVLFFMSDPRGDFTVPFQAGLGIGNAIYQILQPPTTPAPQKPY